MSQSRPVNGTAAPGRTNSSRPARNSNAAFAPSMSGIGSVHQFPEQYPLGYHRHDPGFGAGPSAAFPGFESEGYRADIVNRLVHQQGSFLSPPWSQYSGTGFRQGLDMTAQSYMYPIDSTFSAAQTKGKCFLCESCVVSFSSHRDKKRHDDTVHGDKKYICKCLYETGRKDNHLRHLKDSCRANDNAGQVFTCICGETSNNPTGHKVHVEKCGKRRAGRPSHSSRSTA